jgi:DNA-binding NarL/FixJ family response regulator
MCVQTFSAAREQLSSAARGGRSWDLVLLDDELPDGSGTQLLPLVERLTPQPTSVVVSRHLDAAICIELWARGVAAVNRPIALEQMRVLVELVEIRRQSASTLERYALSQSFSRREVEVLQLSFIGLRQREIAERLGCSEGSIKTLSQRVCLKAGKESLRDVVAHVMTMMSSSVGGPPAAMQRGNSGLYRVRHKPALYAREQPAGVQRRRGPRTAG